MAPTPAVAGLEADAPVGSGPDPRGFRARVAPRDAGPVLALVTALVTGGGSGCV